MSNNPFRPPDSDFSFGMGMGSIPGQRERELKQPTPRIGPSRRPRRMEKPVEEPLSDPYPQAIQEPKEEKPKVRLHGAQWDSDKGYFEEKVRVSVRGELPKELKHLTRVLFTLSLLRDDGGKSQVKIEEGHLMEGKAEVTFMLPQPWGGNGTPVEEARFLFTAKHRESDAVESRVFSATLRKDEADELAIEVENPARFRKGRHALRLRSGDGKYDSTLASENLEKANGAEVLRFKALEVGRTYTLELLGPEGKVVENVFSNREFGKWM